MLAVMAVALALTSMVVKTFFDLPTLMTSDRLVPSLRVPFPAITFCSPYSIVKFKATIFLDEMYVGICWLGLANNKKKISITLF